MEDLQEHPDGDTVAELVLPVFGADGVCLTDYGPDPVVEAGGSPRTGEQRQVEAIAACPPGPVLDAWLRGLDQRVLSPLILGEVVAAHDRMESHQHARKLAAVAELASRPEMSPDWSPLAGAPPVQSSVAGDELSARLGWSKVTANKVVHRASILHGMLSATGQALAAGRIDAAKAEVLATALTDLAYQAAHAVEDAVLPDAARCSTTQLRQRVEREIRLVDPDGEAGRHQRARRTRRVSHPRRQPHGMASMWVVLAAEDATRVDGVLEHAARSAQAIGDGRTLDQLRADGLRDLVVGDVPPSGGPAVEVVLDPPAPVPTPRRSQDRFVTTIRHAPRKPRSVPPRPTATLVPVADGEASPATQPAGTRAARHGCGGRCTGRPGAEVRVTISAATLLGVDDAPADLDGYGPVDAVRARALATGGVWRRVVTDPRTDRVLDLGRERYRPSAELAELIRARDRTCTFPGCTVPAKRADLDHTKEFHPQPGAPPGAPLGRTDADNLGPACPRHHRLKTDGGFRLRQIEPGLFEWITPTGHRYLVRPGTGQSHDATSDPYDAPPPF
jgi:hypothetical protein